MPAQLYITSTIAYVLFLVSDVLTRRISCQTNTFNFLFQRTKITVLLALIWLFISGSNKITPDFETLAKLFLCSIVVSLGIFGFVQANKYLLLTNILSIHLFGIVLQYFVAFFILHENITLLLIVCLSLSLVGLGMHAQIPKNLKGVLWAILSTLGWTLGYALLSIPLKQTNAIWGNLMVESTILIISLLAIKFTTGKSLKTEFNASQSKSIYLIGIVSSIGAVIINYNFKTFNISHISFLSIWYYPISLLVYNRLFFDKISRKEWIGNGLIVVSATIYLLAT